MTHEQKLNLMRVLCRDIISCEKCSLHKTRTNTVPGSGSVMSDIVFVGEAPGKDEDEQGLPFVGRSGKLLTKVLEELGRSRKDVFILNVIKCRPPENRDPSSEEIKQCTPYLKKQLEIVKPKVIITLGKYASQNLLDTDAGIGMLRGQWHEYEGIPLMAVYHPAYILRNNSAMPKFKADIKKALERVNERKGE